MMMWLIACPMLFLAGFVDSVAGGGGLIAIPAFMFAGLSPRFAIGTNKISATCGTAVSAVHYIREDFVRWKITIPATGTAFLGSYLGSHLNLLLKERTLQIFILAVLPFIAFYVLRNKNFEGDTRVPFSEKKTMVLCAGVSLCVGIYDGLYGPGGGTFFTLLFMGLCRRRIQEATGMTKVINLATDVAAFWVYLTNGAAMLSLGLVCGVCNMAGNYLGSHYFSRKGGGFVKWVILTVLVIFFIKTLYELTM